MSKEIIRFKGLSLNRDEQSADKGELSVCAGVELHDGALRPSVLEGTKVPNKLVVEKHYDWSEDVSKWTATLLYVHETASYRHFIGTIETLENELWWFNEDGTIGSNESIHNFREEIISVNSVGNTLIVLTKSGLYYALWMDSSYKYLGDEIPFVEINFRPSENKRSYYDNTDVGGAHINLENENTASRLINNSPYNLFYASEPFTDQYYPIEGAKLAVREDASTELLGAVWALINQTNNTIAKDGRFYAPFLIRYCYRLYDGTSLIMHSAPVFMNVSSPSSYYVFCWNAYTERVSNNDIIRVTDRIVGAEGKTIFGYMPHNVGIRYNVSSLHGNANRLQKLKEEWADIVKSIDVFVSPMMTREKSNEKIDYFVSKKRDVRGVRDNELTTYDYYQDGDANSFYADIPLAEEKDYLEKLRNCSTFYKLMSFNLDTDNIVVDESYHDLSYDKNVVANITSQELMKDDYHSHCKMSPMSDNAGLYIYNHRVNLFGMYEKLFEGFSVKSMINSYSGETEKYVGKVVVELHTEEGTKYVEKDCHGEAVPVCAVCNSILFYPDSRAVNMTLYFCNSEGVLTDERLSMKMEAHSFLNGAVTSPYFYKTSFADDIVSSTGAPTIDDLVPMRNKVITSEVDDPYYFPLEGRNTVGIGAIVGLAAVTRALSQGQVGDHDLVAFCTDGIWVMKVSSEGTYSAIHNISREVCTNQKSICQLDQSVVFATQRSLSRFVESNVISMSDMLDGPWRDWSSLFGTFFDGEDGEPIRRQLADGTPAVDLFNKGSVFYDYAGSRVVVLPEDTSEPTVALVFSIRDQTWSTMAIPAIMAVVPGYPSPFVQLDDGTIRILDRTYDYEGAEASHGLILTRTLTFSDTMDVIRGFQHHADSEAAPVLFLFGSNDQINWQQLGNSNRWFQNYLPGRSFRFFRVAVFMQMKPSEEYQQLMLEVVNKYAKL